MPNSFVDEVVRIVRLAIVLKILVVQLSPRLVRVQVARSFLGVCEPSQAPRIVRIHLVRSVLGVRKCTQTPRLVRVQRVEDIVQTAAFHI